MRTLLLPSELWLRITPRLRTIHLLSTPKNPQLWIYEHFHITYDDVILSCHFGAPILRGSLPPTQPQTISSGVWQIWTFLNLWTHMLWNKHSGLVPDFRLRQSSILIVLRRAKGRSTKDLVAYPPLIFSGSNECEGFVPSWTNPMGQV